MRTDTELESLLVLGERIYDLARTVGQLQGTVTALEGEFKLMRQQVHKVIWLGWALVGSSLVAPVVSRLLQ